MELLMDTNVNLAKRNKKEEVQNSWAHGVILYDNCVSSILLVCTVVCAVHTEG